MKTITHPSGAGKVYRLYCAIMYEGKADRKYEGDRDAKEQNTKEQNT